MGTVKYMGPVASFHCPTNAEIRSLKVHFSPKQLGEGDPSPENVREIVGWDGVNVEQSRKNLWGGSAMKQAVENVFPIISTENNVITYSNSGAPQADGSVLFSTFKPNTQYTLILTYSKSTNVYTHIAFLYSDGSFTMHNREALDNPNTKTTEIYVSKANKTLSAIIRKADEYSNVTLYCDESGLFEGIITKNEYEPYRGETTDYEFGVLGKNKFNNAVPYKSIEGVAANKIQNKDDLLAGLAAGQMIFYGLAIGGSIGEEILYNINNQVYIVMKVAPNTAYCFSGSIDGGARTEHFIKQFSYFDANFIRLSNGTQTNGVFTVPNDSRIKYICVYVHNYAQSSSQNPWSISDVLNSLQIELGSTATEYEPYDPKHTVYGGWVDLISGEVCETHIKEGLTSVNHEALSAQYNTTQTVFFRCATQYIFDTTNIYLRSENLKYLNSNWGSGDTQDNLVNSLSQRYKSNQAVCLRMYNNVFNINADDTVQVKKEKINVWLSSNPIYICYKLQTPNTYYLAPTQLQTFLGRNNVWSNADYVEVEYDLHETQDILNRKAFIMANQPHIVKPAAASLQNFKTDVIAPLKECKVHFGPVQDLHGYSNPWPAGGGKNIVDYTNSANWRVAESATDRTVTSDMGTISLVNGVVTLSRTHRYAGLTVILGVLQADTQYTLSGTFTNIDGKAYIALLDGDISDTYTCTRKFTIAFVNNVVTFTPTETGIYELLVWRENTNPITISNLQLEKGSTATSYAPYENVCPISGQTRAEVYRTGKNLLNEVFLADYSNYPIQGNYGYKYTEPIFLEPNTTYWFSFVTRQIYETTRYWAVKVYDDAYTDINDAGIVRYLVNGKYSMNQGITTGAKGAVRFAIYGGQATLDDIWNNTTVQLELGSTATEYEPYNGEIIPITFPATTNLFNEQWEQGNIELGNDVGSSTCMRTGFIDVNPSTSYYLYTSRENNVFIFEYLEDGTYADKVNGVHTSHTFTTGSTTKKIRIVDRNSGTETVNTGINYPATITYYEPYGTIYGGYVDLVRGEVVIEYEMLSDTWGNWGTVTDQGDGTELRYKKFTNPVYGDSIGNNISYCNVAKYYYTNNNGKVHFYIPSRSYNCRIYLPSGTDTNLQIRAVGKLITPITYQLTPTQLKALRGTNNIWSNANGNIELAYWSH